MTWTDILLWFGVIIIWWLLSSVILPKLGVPT